MAPQNFKENCPVVHVICKENRGVNPAIVDFMLIGTPDGFSPDSPVEDVMIAGVNIQKFPKATEAAIDCRLCVMAGQCALGDFFRRQNT